MRTALFIAVVFMVPSLSMAFSTCGHVRGLLRPVSPLVCTKSCVPNGRPRLSGAVTSTRMTGDDFGEQKHFASQLEMVIHLANKTSTLGWKHSQEDSTNARDRDGTWVTRNDKMIEELKSAVNATVPRKRAWTWLKQAPRPFYVPVCKTPGVEIRIHFIPTGQTLPPLEHPTGSVVLSKALFGVCDVRQMLGNPRGRTPMRETVRTLIKEDDVLLYLGGPCRVYGEGSMENPCAILEVSLVPMLKITGMSGFVSNEEGDSGVMEMAMGMPSVYDLLTEARMALVEDRQDASLSAKDDEAGDLSDSDTAKEEISEMNLSRMKRHIGGLDEQISTIVRRTFASRRIPYDTMTELGLRHVRGMLLYGPPGCGKTLIAREISKALRSRPPKIVNGPEILDKWVGEAERNVRALFFDAESEWIERGGESALHVIILDEMDAFAKRRGTLSGDSSGVRDSVVNQLLAIMDGVREMDNFLVIGLTNRKDLIDPALLRPGRLEVHLEINAPDAKGREEILEIHMRKLRNSGRLADQVWDALPSIASRDTEGYTGADLAGLVRSATSFALERALDMEMREEGAAGAVMVELNDLHRALKEVRPVKGSSVRHLGRLFKTLRGAR